jgi:hypothetical protein
MNGAVAGSNHLDRPALGADACSPLAGVAGACCAAGVSGESGQHGAASSMKTLPLSRFRANGAHQGPVVRWLRVKNMVTRSG